MTVWVGEMPPCPAHRCGPMSFGENRLTFWIDCNTPMDCDAALRVIDTLETYGDER